MKNYFAIIVIISLFFISACKHQNPVVVIETDAGFIGIELQVDKAPITCYNFLNYIEKSKFDGGEFYRVVTLENQSNNEYKIEVVQGGMGWSDTLDRYKPIMHETTSQTQILHKKGVVSMARNEPGTANSEFFICMDDEPELDFGGKRNSDGQGFAAFGHVVEGFEIVKRIHQMPDSNQFLLQPVKILSAKIVN